jgi:dCTP deaminase
MIASAQTIRKLQPIRPFSERAREAGMSFGLSAAGYDIRIRESVEVPVGGFVLASSLEEFHMPNNWLAIVHDKSTWARMGICVQNTVIEPGWTGYLTLEISNHNQAPIRIIGTSPIAQIIFHILDQATEQPYNGKYQNQPARPIDAILER